MASVVGARSKTSDSSESPLIIACKERDLAIAMEELTENNGWPYALSQFVRTCHMIDADSRVREAIFKLLQLEELMNADIDPVSLFSSLEAYSINEAQQKAARLAKGELRRLVRARNTFFLDTDTLLASQFASTIPSITKARQREIRELPAEVTMTQVLRTYYGYTIFSSIVIWSVDAPELMPAKETFRELAKSLGRPLEIFTGRACLNFPWMHVSKEMRLLLHNLMRLNMTCMQTKFRATTFFTENADLRARTTLAQVSNVCHPYDHVLSGKVQAALESIDMQEFRNRGLVSPDVQMQEEEVDGH
jgi:hypothetical protein